MKTKNKSLTYMGFLGSILSIGMVVWILLTPVESQASPPDRPTPTPVHSGTQSGSSTESSDASGTPPTAYITLQGGEFLTTAWTIVQWQDSAGSWHNVDGWQGTFDDNQQKIWTVEEKDFGTGPFRWVVYEGQNGKPLAESEAFFLPDGAFDTTSIGLRNVP